MKIDAFKAPEIQVSHFTELYLQPEQICIDVLLKNIRLDEADRAEIFKVASNLAQNSRDASQRSKLIDQFLQEYGLSTQEGVTLMRLCEALIRTPDPGNADYLIRDKIGDADWKEHLSGSSSNLVNLSTFGLQMSQAWVSTTGGVRAKHLLAKIGDTVLREAMQQAMNMMGDHFVLGDTINSAIKKAKKNEANGYSHSYDMLGEAAHTLEDAERYFQSYFNAITTLAATAKNYGSIAEAPGISVKLSALHPRYEYAQRETCVPKLVEKLLSLVQIAKQANIGLTIDAEECDRLEISLEIVSHLLENEQLDGWHGLGVVVQAYQRRAPAVIDTLGYLAREHKKSITVRLVKGAYWDMEIKRAQEMGLESYPVFTRKENTDVSYIACAQQLFAFSDCIFPQFATHNAHTAAAVMHLAGPSTHFEFQRLHGMGDSLHNQLISDTGVRSRVYAPVGRHKDLLPYLVRRLLENGANSSFVNQLLDPAVEISSIVHDPIEKAETNDAAQHPNIADPRDQFSRERQAAYGIDLTQATTAARVEALGAHSECLEAFSVIDGEDVIGESRPVYSPTDKTEIGFAHYVGSDVVNKAVETCQNSSWRLGLISAPERASILNTAADLLEAEQDRFLFLCMKEAGKTYLDGVAEVREAVDFCRYYANQATMMEIAERAPLGTVACISPWNFPLAIFLGQITASLAVGNCVVAKPAEQTPVIAYEAVKLLCRAGLPNNAISLLIGNGAEIGSALVSHKDIDGVCFTGSTATAKRIAANLASTGRSRIPLIAETGGLNAMIIDSTALLEQAVGDVVASAFQSAGQRCSACRFVCVQEDVADAFIEMLKGSMQVLNMGDPASMKTDVGPVIDQAAQSMLNAYVETKSKKWKLINQTSSPADLPAGYFVKPTAFEIGAINELEHEMFGPILHVVRFKAKHMDQLVDEINALGYGLTLGLHTRIDARIERVSKRAKVGNVYVNRNQIGAVVGVQPFGGEGLSGTGPKAGGPHYLKRLSRSPSTPLANPGFQTLPAQTSKNFTDKTLKSLQRLLIVNPKTDIAAIYDGLADFIEDRNIERTTLLRTLAKEVRTVYDIVEPLPGPTGENNTLRLEPRGVLLCLGGNEESDLEAQILRSLASGNAVLAAAEPEQFIEIDSLLDELAKAGLNRKLVERVSPAFISAYLNADIAGCVAEDSIAGTISNVLATRSGQILPVLSRDDDPDRFCVERTVTVNTTAAGGNASLLAM